jgi:glucose/arabinose dehydrogenase
MLITEISGKLLISDASKTKLYEVEGVPKVYVQGQGGLLDVIAHPNFPDNKVIYLSYASHLPQGDSGSNTAILKAELKDRKLVNKKVIYQAEPNTKSGVHFGSRMAFDSEGYLYFSIGDRGERDKNPQDISRDGGKIYRIKDDGSIPADNPFVGQTGARTAIYSFGHRNPQGLSKHPISGDIWEHEHGPRGGDEINIIKKGKNYGWPVISYGINYSGTHFALGTHKDGMVQPVSHWTPSIAPCGMTFVEGDKYPEWKGNLLVGSLKFRHLVRVVLQDDKVISQHIVAAGIGRVRNVKQGPDGYIYVAIEGAGIFKLLP